MTTLNRVKEKLDLLRGLDTKFQIFGASEHKYNLNPVIPLSQLEYLERKYGIELPSDYREFMLFFGNGGVGPYYGIFPFEKSVASIDSNLLTRPFLYTSSWNGIQPPDWWNSDHATIVRDKDYFDDSHLQGSFRVAHEGSGYYALLVVTGPERGSIWGDYRASDGGILPINTFENNSGNSVSRLNFISWYESWVDSKLQKLI